MKKLLVILLLIAECSYASGTPPDIGSICSVSNGYQGMAFDGTYFYTGLNLDNKVYKYNTSCQLQASFACPGYCAGIDIRKDHDTLIACAGYTNNYVVWEIDKSAGTKIREWDFSGEPAEHGYPQGGLCAYYGADKILNFTSDPSYNFKIALYTVNDDGTFTWVKTWSHTTLGIPQGLFYDATRGRVYYAVTVTQGSDNRIYEITLSDTDSSTTLNNYAKVTGGTEVEGIHSDGTYMYYHTWTNGGPYTLYKFLNSFYNTCGGTSDPCPVKDIRTP